MFNLITGTTAAADEESENRNKDRQQDPGRSDDRNGQVMNDDHLPFGRHLTQHSIRVGVQLDAYIKTTKNNIQMNNTISTQVRL